MWIIVAHNGETTESYFEDHEGKPLVCKWTWKTADAPGDGGGLKGEFLSQLNPNPHSDCEEKKDKNPE